jgi:hypothetical protein
VAAPTATQPPAVESAGEPEPEPAAAPPVEVVEAPKPRRRTTKKAAGEPEPVAAAAPPLEVAEAAKPRRRTTRKAAAPAPEPAAADAVQPDTPKRTRRVKSKATDAADTDLLPGGPAPKQPAETP